ncbi:class I SAM-dependent methyltransferase [Thermococcus sp.]|uniref:methyltransferase domain-containing protein n=1 Tax=Thermococcus sp. TaxID=35749 RepID=UPI002612839D|nr:class I SAM-dependent methyltransferase [Thermococcus sp.]
MEEFYRHFRWWMEPSDEKAIERLWSIVRFFESYEKASSVLDLCAGTGIAGVAAAKALSASKLTLVEMRRKDARKVSSWIKMAGINPELKVIAEDILELPSLVGKHDVAVLFGRSMPHFDPFQAVKLFAGVALVLGEDGRFFIEETDRIYRFLYRRAYEPVRVEIRREDYSIISLYEGYKVERGVERRGYYRLPGFEKVMDMDLRPWDLASLLAIGKVFFSDAELIKREMHGIAEVSDVMLFSKPRKEIAGELYSQF